MTQFKLMVDNLPTETITRVAAIRFQKVGKLYHFDCSGFPDLQQGDQVIVETMRGRQMGEVVEFYPPDTEKYDYKPILALATPADLLLKQQWDAKGLTTLIEIRELAKGLGGYDQCKFLAVQYSYDGATMTVMYSMEDLKININRLRNAITGRYPAKIDLRQVGPRDVAKLIGGMGACGIPRCCSTFLTDFSPVSIKMAKAQGISLNPSEITGMCGRLRCCLVYEYEQYVEARAQLPKRNKRVGTPQGPGKVIDVHPLQDAVTVLIEDNRLIFKRDELVPLDELEALDAKAKAGCSRHESGGCDCGAKRGGKSEDEDESDDTDLPLDTLEDNDEDGDV
ncbi:MAG: stage 0 sporulation family protein [Anaerolinea sp.]|nr:stage 0 sporulation family protein [Anaerolinea sp.]MCC6973243.1 stage 0 sporulation family protein [Anaerolineae bacterium]